MYEISVSSVTIHHHQNNFKFLFLDSYFKKLGLCVNWRPSDLHSQPDVNLTTYISTSTVSQHFFLKILCTKIRCRVLKVNPLRLYPLQ